MRARKAAHVATFSMCASRPPAVIPARARPVWQVGDRLREGIMTFSQFRRTLDVLRVFRLTAAELGSLEEEYQVTVSRFGGPDVRFHYRRFCEDLQPTGHGWAERHAQLPVDDSDVSPLAVRALPEGDMGNLAFVLERIGTAVLKRRAGFRALFEDFDRTTKTRSGSSRHNYTLNAGCISRSQMLQVQIKTVAGFC